jgi:hypothetical protein
MRIVGLTLSQAYSVIARLVRATQFVFSKNKLGRPHKAGDDSVGSKPNDALAI